jgi:hypothetical protein
MFLRILIAVLALASICCETRKEHSFKHASQVSNDALAAKEEAPRIGGPFVHWLPLLKSETDMSDHGHYPNLGSVWFYRENEPRVILGEAVELIRIARREQPLESAVVEVIMSLVATPTDKREEAFRQLANQLFGCGPTTTLMDRNVRGAEVLRLKFDGKGRADFDPAMGTIQFCSVEWEGYEHARYGSDR